MAFQTENFDDASHPFSSATMGYYQGEYWTAGLSSQSESFGLGSNFNLASFAIRPLGNSAADYVRVVGRNAAGDVVYTDQFALPVGQTTTVNVNSVVKTIELIPVTISGGFTTEYAGNAQFIIDNVHYDLDLPANSAPQITGAGLNPFPYLESAAVYPFQSPNVTILDSDGDQVTVTVTPNQLGTGLFTAQPTQDGDVFVLQNGVLTFTGSAADATAALRNVYLTNTNVDGLVDTGQSTILGYTITVDDGHGNVVTNTAAAATVIAENEAPTITASGNVSLQPVATTGLIKPFTTFLIDDPDNKTITSPDQPADTLYVQVRFPDANGVLEGVGWTKISTAGGNAVWQFVGNFEQATTAIQAVQFNPTDTNPNVGTVTTNFSLSVSDSQFTTQFVGQASVVARPNAAPVATADSVTVAEGGTVALLSTNNPSVLGNDTDADGDPLRAVVVSQTSQGTLTLNQDGTFSYTHNGGEIHSDAFTYKANDGLSDSQSVTVNINITPVDDVPTAVPTTATVIEDSIANNIPANIVDVDGGPKTIITVAPPANGVAAIAADGLSIIYTPNPDFFGDDSFTYTLNGGAVGTVTVSVAGTNDAPVAAADAAAGNEGSTITVLAGGTTSVLANDVDVDMNSLTAVLVTQPINGTLTLNANGTFSYVHNGSETTSDSFTYKTNDGTVDSAPITVSLTISPVNDEPVAGADTAAGDEGSTITVLTSGATSVLANDVDAEGEPLTAVVVIAPNNGTLTLNANGTFSYVHNGSETTSDSFTYKVNDGTVDSVPITVSISIGAVDDTPLAIADAATVGEDSGSTAIDVLANDTDPDGGPKTIATVSQGANGTVVLGADGTGLSYTPNANFFGEDSFTYALNGGQVGTVTVTVTADNDAPVIDSDGGGDLASINVNERQLAVTSVSAIDVEGGPITFALATDLLPGNADAASFTIDLTTGALQFVARPDFEAPGDADADNIYLVGVTASDGTLTDTQWLSINVLNISEGGGGVPPDPEEGQGPPVIGTEFSDKLSGTPADETFDGLASTDYLELTGNRAEYTITIGNDGLPSLIVGPDGTDQLISIERLKFADGVLAFDDEAQQIYRLYEAAFNRDPDLGGLSFWVEQFDSGNKDLLSAALDFLYSPEFIQTYGNVEALSLENMVELLYVNILDREGEEGGVQYWVGQLQQGLSKEHLLAHFSESVENQAAVNPEIVGGVLLDNSVF